MTWGQVWRFLDELAERIPRTRAEAGPELSKEEKENAQELIDQARKDMEKGYFQEAYEKIAQADDLLVTNKEVSELRKKVKPVSEVYPVLEVTNKKTRLASRCINYYLRGNGRKALNSVTYASQLWPQDNNLKSLLSLVTAEFPKVASEQNLLPGINLVEQRLQEALELIYDKKYVGAISRCNEVLELEPRNVLALARKGSAYWAMGQEDMARKIWRKALKYDPGNKQLIKFIGMKKGRRLEGEEEAKPSQKSLEKARAEYKNALSYYERVKRSGASQSTLKGLLQRMIEKFENSGVDISNLHKELKNYR